MPAGTGTVTSVALTAPAILSVAGSPVTGSGTLALTLATQTANLVWAGPTSGGAAAPTFRSLVIADESCQVSCRVTHSTTQTLTTAVPAMLSFDTETWDSGTLHSTSSNTSRITAVVAGRYHVSGSCAFAASAAGWRMLRIKKNATTYYNQQRSNALADVTAGTMCCTGGMVDLAATDYVELEATQTSGGNLAVSIQEFSAVLLGP
jgi:hypothetical protein